MAVEEVDFAIVELLLPGCVGGFSRAADAIDEFSPKVTRSSVEWG